MLRLLDRDWPWAVSLVLALVGWASGIWFWGTPQTGFGVIDQWVPSVAVSTGELAPCETDALAEVIQATWNGALLTWTTRGRGALKPWALHHVDAVIDFCRLQAVAIDEPDNLMESLRPSGGSHVTYQAGL